MEGSAMTTTDRPTENSLRYGMSTEELAASIDMENLVITDDPLPDDIPVLAPGEEIMVPITFRVTTSDFFRIKALAEQRKEKYTVMVRNWVEAELAEAERDAEHPLTREDLLKAIDLLRKLLDQPKAAAA
jgi:hypothetical protein